MKKQFKSQASSSRAGGLSGGFGSQGFGSSQPSVLSYAQELPDYSSLKNSTLVVTFKNLSKKDATTKAKALEDLQASVEPQNAQVDDSLLDAWAKLFPRLSIDNARRVRQLAYLLNGHIWSKAGKRTVKHMPRIAGSWLAGAFDGDRPTAKAAVDGLNAVFPTPEKIQGVRKAFQRPIVEYCRDAILHETIQTLSDERMVNSNDAEAIYCRVVASSLLVINMLIVELPLDDQEKEDDTYNEVLSSESLWEATTSTDAAVRRSAHRLIRSCISRKPGILQANIKIMSNTYVYKGLHSNQTGSALEYMKTLLTATTTFSDLWTDAYSSKRTAISRLRHFLKQGSQSGPAEFWDILSTLVTKLPIEILPTGVEEITWLLSSARAGVSKKEERLNAAVAWSAYFKLVDVLIASIPGPDFEKIVHLEALPIIEQYLFPDQDKTEWTIAGTNAGQIAAQVATIANIEPLLIQQWPTYADSLIGLAKTSQPEQSKEYEKSQNSVTAAGDRWARLQKQMWALELVRTTELSKVLDTCNLKLLDECVALLESRNGKPFGAAGIIEQLFRSCSNNLLASETFRAAYIHFIEKDSAGLVFGPSGKHLIQGLLATRLPPSLAPCFSNLLRNIVEASVPAATKFGTLDMILRQDMSGTVGIPARGLPEFQKFIVDAIPVESKDGSGSLFADLIRSGALTEETVDSVLSNLTASLDVTSQSSTALSTIDQISLKAEPAIRKFMTTPNGTGDQLLPSLLRLERSSQDEIAERAATLSSKLSSTITESTSNAKYAVVLQNLEKVSRNSMPIDALLDLTMRLLGPESNISDPSEILPHKELRLSALLGVLDPPTPSLALMSILGGAVHFVQPTEGKSSSNVQYDAEGFSQALRIAMFISRLLTETDAIEKLGILKAPILAFLQIAVAVAEDGVSVLASNKLCKGIGAIESETAVLDFISEANMLLSGYWETLIPNIDADASTETSRFFSALEEMRANAALSSPISYYIAVCIARLYSNLFELHGFSTDQIPKCEAIIRSQRSQDMQLNLTSSIVGLQTPLAGTPSLTRLFNDLVAQLTDANVEQDELRFFAQLNILNTIMRTQDEIFNGIPKQRLIFLIKRLLASLGSPVDVAIKTEVFRALATLFSGIRDMYGEHWEKALDAMIEIWTLITAESEHGTVNESHVLIENTSLKALAALRKLATSQDSNDDLMDALKERKLKIQDALVNLLTAADGISDENHQPLRITYELLARQVAATAMSELSNLDEMYPLVYAPSRAIQQAAFRLLHKEIPAAQEKISFDAAIDNKTAQLPEELLSLILEAPTLDSLVDASFHGAMPLSLQGYLYSWRLVFDHFQGSSYKVKSDYIEQLKDGTYLSGLLTLTFDFLGHTNGRPADVSKFNIQDYTSDEESSPEKDVQWLLTHLYYLALTHLPSLVRNYYLELRSRQLPQVIENWTAKHVSPLIIGASLKDVLAWAEKPKEDLEFEKVTFKVGFRSREITASYEVDEQTMSMKIVLPEAYPLASAQVLGINRVAVNEEKWQSWLRNCQGVIAFSNGSLIDGLSAWRRNATGAMKGQTECAICYSIVSADKKIPNKKCPTCKHMFHSSCLLKWFKTSNASTCPLCRNTFSFV